MNMQYQARPITM